MLEIDLPNALLIGFGWPGGMEMVILLVLGLLIFGRRLPEVGRSLGRSIVEFKRGIKGLEDVIDDESAKATSGPERLPDDSRRSELPNAAARDEPAAAESHVKQKARED